MAVAARCRSATRLLPRPSAALSRPALRRAVSSRPATRCQATEGSKAPSSNIEFLGKLLVTSFAGGALIKYGSLAIDLPFQPSPAIALSFIFLPCIVCAAYLNSLGSKP